MPRLIVNFYGAEKPGVAGKLLGRWHEAPAVPRVTWKRANEHGRPDDVTAELLVEPSTDQQIADLEEAAQPSGDGDA